MAVTEAVENYLETILIISRGKTEVHAIDICDYLNYSRPTVSVVVRQLRDQGFLEIDADNHITLTPSGREVAEKMYERHDLLAKMLISIGVSEKTAFHDACKIEHDLSAETFDCIRNVYGKFKDSRSIKN